MSKLKKYLPYLLFFSIVIVAFYQVTFFLHPVKYDMIDCFYPWRFYIGECLQNGQLPYWNPFQDLGYPIHADPSSGAWYPMVWLIGYFNGYTIYTIGFEYWIHVFFAGIGFYTLARTLKFEQNYAVLAGVAYMLCGLFVGNAQHLPYIVSATWLPYVLNYYFRLLEEKSYKNSLRAAFFLFLMITGGYPAFTIILFYLFVLFFGIYLVKTYRTKIKKDLIHFLLRHALFFISTILLSLVLLVSIYQVSPYLSRLGDFSLQQALYSPFSPQSFVSFVLPLVSTTPTDYFNSDPSMRNGYFGLFVLLFFLLGIFSKKPLKIKVLFYFGIFSLTAAVGEYLPVREFLFKYVPMMNVFRFPSVFRLFFILAGILVALHFLQKNFLEKELKKKPFFIAIAGLGIFFVGIIILGASKNYLPLSEFVQNDLFTASSRATYWQNATFQSIIQLILLGIFVLILWRIKSRKKILTSILLLTTFDLFLATQLNTPYTMYSDNVIASEASNNVAEFPKGFPSQENISIEEAAHLPAVGSPFWRNTNDFQKQISAEGFNSFSFTSYEFLENEYPQLYSELKKNHVVLLSESIFEVSKLNQHKEDSLFRSNHLYFEMKDFEQLKSKSLRHQKGDTAFIQSYDAANFKLVSMTRDTQLLTLFQKEYTGWKAYIDNDEVPIYKSNLNFMTVILPSGKHIVTFEYRNPGIKIAFIISAISLFSLLLFLIYPFKKK